MILLIASEKDIASLNIKEQILNNYSFRETEQTFEQNPTYTADNNDKKVTLVTLKEESVKAQNLPDIFPEAKKCRTPSRVQYRHNRSEMRWSYGKAYSFYLATLQSKR